MPAHSQPTHDDKDSQAVDFAQATRALVADFARRRPLRAVSLLVSVFGDAIAPRGGTVWLGSLINALEAFGVNQRLVRTSVFRLARDGWLTSEQIGRRSYYSLTPIGLDRIEVASRRIYSEPRTDWPGTWVLVLLAGVDTPLRENLRKQLAWLGFAPFSASLMAHPAIDLARVQQQLTAIPGNDKLLIMQAQVDDGRASYLRELVRDSWALEELGRRYADFLAQFGPVYRRARRARQLSPEHAFAARTLLIHEYRKIVLRDPLLPTVLLPDRWDGVAAYRLCCNLYQLIGPVSEHYLAQHMETADGPLPVAEPSFFHRFGGLSAEDS